MFWRIVRRLLIANGSRLFVILLALGAGAAVTSALLNLQIDARRRLRTEFRTFGANVMVAPRATTAAENATMSEDVLQQLPTAADSQHASAVAFLYLLGGVSRYSLPRNYTQVVVAGTSFAFCISRSYFDWAGASGCAIGLSPRPAICGKMYHIQCDRFSPSRNSDMAWS